jgi:NhaP-type Na+/H+ or K+/H+ antiporter
LYFGALDRCVSLEGLKSGQKVGKTMISVLIGILIICVVGAICFWAIDKFVRDARLANLLKLLVVLICLAAILQRVLPLAGIGGL